MKKPSPVTIIEALGEMILAFGRTVYFFGDVVLTLRGWPKSIFFCNNTIKIKGREKDNQVTEEKMKSTNRQDYSTVPYCI